MLLKLSQGWAVALALTVAAPTLTAQTSPRLETRAQPTVRQERSATSTLPERLQRLRGPHRVDDQRLRRQFDQTVELLIQLQRQDLQIDAELQREIRARRTQRRTPLGQRQLNNVEPTHIPAVEMLRAPFS